MVLIDEIRSAFADCPRIAPDQYVRGGDWQDDEIVNWLTTNDCQVNQAFVEEFTDCLPNFTLDGLVRVFPDYLEYCILHPSTQACEYVVSKIRHLSQHEIASQYFSKEQRCAIRHFLLHSRRYFFLGGVFAEMIEKELAPDGPWTCD